MFRFFLLFVFLLNSTNTFALEDMIDQKYRRPFIGINIHFSGGVNDIIFPDDRLDTGRVELQTMIAPEFYLAKPNSKVYFYLQLPLSASFFPKYLGMQFFGVGALAGFGAYLKEATEGEDNLSVTMNFAAGGTLNIGYDISFKGVISFYFSIVVRHYLDASYAIQYGPFTFINIDPISNRQTYLGGVSVGFAFETFK